jgi:hypothetical protein
VTVSNVVVVNATQITVTFAIGAGAALGAANVSVTTAAGTSGTVAFTVTGIAISVAPTAATLRAGQPQQFSATVTGSANTAVTWSLTYKRRSNNRPRSAA